MSTYDPNPDAPYGTCSTCSLVIATEADANEHLRQTIGQGDGAGHSHSVRITNPSRPDRIRRRIAMVIDDAIADAMDELDRLTSRGDNLTEAEVAEALRMWPDFSEAWDDYTEDAS